VCLGAGLAETVKWGHPCYVHAGRNIAIIGAFRDDFRLNFFNAALLADRGRVLERQGPNSASPGTIRFADNGSVAAMAPLIAAYLKEAMAFAEAGTLPPKPVVTLDLPEELAEALDTDPVLAEAFDRLTPGRQRGYVINLGAAKSRETRVARIERFRDRILAGKGVTERSVGGVCASTRPNAEPAGT